MKRTSTISLLFFGAVLYFLFASNSNGRATQANTGNTGAPGETAICSSCHSGGNFGPVSVSIQAFEAGTNNSISTYSPGQTYDMRVTVQPGMGSPAGYGFQMTCLTLGANTPLGGYSNLASNVKQKLVTVGTYAGRTYVEHNGVTPNNQFNLSWTAPAAGTGTVRFYAAGNCVNLSGNTSGDLANSTNFTMNEAAALTASGTVENPFCFGEPTGSIDVSVLTGNSPYTFLWSDNADTEDRNNLPAGTYSVTITDALNQVTNLSFDIIEPSELLLDYVSSDATCAGSDNGSVSFTIEGGTPDNNSYMISLNGENGTATSGNNTINNLAAGEWTLMVLDMNACSQTAVFTITAPEIFEVTASAEPMFCNDEFGTVVFQATGGTEPYQQDISTSTVDNPGTYSYTFLDANGCEASVEVTVESPDAFTVESSAIDALCAESCDGQANLESLDATSVVTYLWEDGTEASTRTDLCAGSYIVEATNETGCTVVETVSIFAPGNLVFEVVQENLEIDGSIEVAASGGVGPYEYLWTTGAETATAILLFGEPHSVTITDANGCTVTSQDFVAIENSIFELTEQLLVLYPNPSHTECSFGFQNSTEVFHWNLVGTLGEVILSGKSSGVSKLDVSELANGAYYLVIQTERNTITKQLLIKK
ncbi:MAG: choice-of-anchor V domain-containing protein [Flavobacteriales bacterium]